MTIVIGAGAFAWSFAALTDLSIMAGIDARLAWIGPVFVDGAIVQSIVALVSLQRRERNAAIEVPRATRWFFWAELLVAELISVVGNGLHAAESGQRILPATIAACVAGAAPLFGLAATHGLTALLEVPRTPAVPPMEAVTVVETPAPTVLAALTAGAAAGNALLSPGDTEATTPVASPDAGDSQATAAGTEATASDNGAGPEATADRDTRIYALHRQGLSTREIGAEVGLHHGTVAKIVARIRAERDTDGEGDEGDDPGPDQPGTALALVR
ncbi:DUF2637 domain-containing protein [Nocardia sp. CC227C]|uniref:DUF2637 domain-containing protein n=1 Tax=Nocardia sp. CC227C TaxID=3044562 RepID=UPI00278C63DE|nr:DUF2637 domain-containing protein [Nocardia sp. CC227C]